jgi:hypothetical protein
MTTCARILRTDFGVDTVSQPDISRWESGAIGHPKCVSQLLAYCDAYGSSPDINARSWDASRTGQVGDPLTVVETMDPSMCEEGEFERLAGQVAGEPPLGEAQRELAHGMIYRLAHGPPLSPEDRATYLDLLRILRMPGASADL